MKKLTFIAAVAVALFSCAKENHGYQITVANDNLSDGDMVYLVNYDTTENMDSAVVADGVAVFSGEVEKPYVARAISDGNRLGMVIVEPGVIELKNGEAAGSVTNDKLSAFNEEMSGLEEKFRNATSKEEQQAIYDQYMSNVDSVMKANMDNPIGYLLFVDSAQTMDAEELNAALEEYPQMAEYDRVKKVKAVFDRKAATAPGQMFTDFEIEYNGEVTKLSDFVGQGKYVLVDFWASWCGPCRREASTTLKDLYAEYAPKGLEIVGIAVWDEPENTLKAIDQMQLPWKQVINGQTIPTDLYGILGIPCIILFGPDGTIISRDLQGADLKAAVAEAMGE